MQTILRRNDVQRVTGLPRSTLYYLMSRSEFPKPIKITGGRAVGWLETEVLDWQEARIAQRGERV